MEKHITNELNAPRFEIDGRIIPPMLFGLSDFPAAASNTAYAQKNIKLFADAGINLVCIDTGLHLGWHKAEPFDPEAMIAEISSVLDANPDAKVLMRLHMNPPYWWMRDNPDECVIYRTPEGDLPGVDNGEQDRLIRNDSSHHMRVSLASEKWLSEVSEKLGLLCDALNGTPEGEALLAIQPACGVYGEWHQWGTDVSAPMTAHFRRFLHEKYGSVENLRKAWNSPDVTFETAVFRPETFRPGDDGWFRDPELSRDTMDSQESVQNTPPEAILRFCKVIKERLPGVLTGSFYGYYLGTGGNNMTIGGHLRVNKLYEAKGLIDFLCGPFCYMDNRLPEGTPMQRGLLESSRLRGMLWLTEMDQHPTSVPRLGGDLSNKAETISVLRRNVLQPLFSGQGLWFYDHRVIPKFLVDHPELAGAASLYRKTGWWEDDYLINEIAGLKKLAYKLCSKKYEPVADTLIVYDTDSYFCRAKVFDYDYQIQSSVARSGVVYDGIYANELEIAELDRYKCIIFANDYMMTPERREKFRKLTAGKTRIWLYAQGYCDGKTLAVENLSETVGMKLKRSEGAEKLIGCGLLDGVSVGIPKDSLKPFFAVDDEDAIPLGVTGNGEVCAAMKKYDDGTVDCWIATPKLTRELIEPMIKASDAHIWCGSGDPILACGGFAAINSPAGGHRGITLPDGKMVELELEPFTTEVIEY